MSGFLTFLWNLGGAVGFTGGAALGVFCVLRCLFLQPETIPPAYHRDRRIVSRKARPGDFDPDTAWPSYQFYPFSQARTDVGRTGAELLRRYGRLWRWPADAFFRGRHGPRFLWWLFFPIPLTVLAALLWAALGAAAAFAYFAAVAGAAVGAALVISGSVAGVARGAEDGRRRIMRADASCPHCYHVTPWPAYRCSGCSELHRDLRPGRLGVLWRRCECGARLPTMPLRAAWRLDAFCQRCGTVLPTGSGAVRDIRIPVLGDPSAGKTRFLYAALDSLMASARRADVELGFSDQRSHDEADQGLALIRSGQETIQTSTRHPAPLDIQLGAGRRRTHVHLFDASGEELRDPGRHDDLGYLGLGQGLVYVLDPFTIGSVRNQLSGQHAELARRAAQAGSDPETSFSEAVSRLRNDGVQASRQRLAVVISKVDLLRAATYDMPGDSEAIAAWLTASGVHNLVLAAKRDFAEVRYFAVASQAAAGGRRPDDPGTALRWLLRAHGVRLPAEPAAPAPVPTRPPDSRPRPNQVPQEG